MGSRVYIECPSCGVSVIEGDNGEVTFLCDCISKGTPEAIGDDETTPAIRSERSDDR